LVKRFFEIDFIRGFISYGFMNPLRVVEEKVFVQASTGFGDSQIIMEVNLFIFDRSPKALQEDIIKDPAPAIHTDADTLSFQNSREICAGKLRTLVGVKDLRLRNR